MPKFCVWESAYFLVKCHFKNIFRRQKQGIEANLGDGIYIKTWYFSPAEIKKILPEIFEICYFQAVGFFVPPYYLNSAFEKRKSALNFLEKLENWAVKIPFLLKNVRPFFNRNTT